MILLETPDIFHILSLSLYLSLYITLSQAFIYFIPVYDFLSVTISYAFVELSFVRASVIRFGCL